MTTKNEDAYPLLRLPQYAQNIAASRKKRLYESAIREYGDMISTELQQGRWNVDPSNGDFINDKGQNVLDDLEFKINNPVQPRGHWEIPELPVEEAELIAKVWTEPNITARAARYKQLKDYHKSDKLATIAFTEEAERHGVTKPFTAQIGFKPGEERKSAEDRGSNNPFNPARKFTSPEMRLNEISKYIVRFGSKAASKSASQFGVDLAGRVLKKRA